MINKVVDDNSIYCLMLDRCYWFIGILSISCAVFVCVFLFQPKTTLLRQTDKISNLLDAISTKKSFAHFGLYLCVIQNRERMVAFRHLVKKNSLKVYADFALHAKTSKSAQHTCVNCNQQWKLFSIYCIVFT